jgi:hypothetical protein
MQSNAVLPQKEVGRLHQFESFLPLRIQPMLRVIEGVYEDLKLA